jgi:hypothetical protein
MRNTAIYAVEQEVPEYVLKTGLLTDELEDYRVGIPGQETPTLSLNVTSLDERILPEFTNSGSDPSDVDYLNLQGMRGDINQAVGALAAYDSAAPPALRGELFALKGYTEILLADFFCSGVPLSTIDFQRNFTYQSSASTAQVYTDAIAQLDTALALSSDSARVLNLARVLKGRALLALGNYTAAAQAVAAVPDTFQYQLAINVTPTSVENVTAGSGGNTTTVSNPFRETTVSDREGETGLPYVSSNDPRLQVQEFDSTYGEVGNIVLFSSAKYASSGFSPFTVANGIEARLIEAEAQLQPATAPSGPWLATLNALRATVGLSDTTDPGTATARVSLLFQDRAYWLFLTGHRQGDLRRLIRQYGRRQDQAYPSGPYLGPGAGFYGVDVTAPIPPGEYVNPLFHGCINRDA